jgi:hypothetical protein
MAADFEVRRDDLTETRIVPSEPGDLRAGEALLVVDRFAFTANNITYAAFGDRLKYWQFFPAEGAWGRIPAWGYGTVVASECAGVAPGERYYGYYPMSTHVRLRPDRVSDAGFGDGAAHRQPLHPLYNQYSRTSADPLYDREREPHTLLLRPLFITSFVLDDLLDDNGYFGADAVVLSSASSKTAWGVAFLLSERKRRGASVHVIGLTSPRNFEYVKRLGLYDTVVTYDVYATLPRSLRIAYVDFAGDAAVRANLHQHFGENVVYSTAVGFSHNETSQAPAASVALPGAAPSQFFAPDQIRKRSREWGRDGFASRFADAWRAVIVPASDPAKGWLRVAEGRGAGAVERIYRDALAGRVAPDAGNVLTLC